MDDHHETEALLALANIAAHTEWIAQLLEKLNDTLTDQLAALNKSINRIAEDICTHVSNEGGL